MRMKKEYIISVILVVLVGGGLLVLFKTSSAPGGTARGVASKDALVKTPYHEIVDPSGFVNTGVNDDGTPKAITIKEFIGKKVIMVDFLTYSCINCQRTFPYVNAWDEKYRDQGLEIIGIHTPEFAFEKDINNVREAMKRFGITHPIVLDNAYGTWNAYGNNFWPRRYLIDIYGNIVYDHAGEGAYEETEMKIKELLAERAQVLGEGTMPHDSALVSSTVSVTTPSAQSPETYFGSARNEYLGNGRQGTGGTQRFSLPQTFKSDMLYLGGIWSIVSEYAEATSDAMVVYRYNAKDVYLVAEAGVATQVEVFVDGKHPQPSSKSEVDGQGMITIKESRLYHVATSEATGEHVLKLQIHGRGVRLYTFTFG